jgi:hypothetical protein
MGKLFAGRPWMSLLILELPNFVGVAPMIRCVEDLNKPTVTWTQTAFHESLIPVELAI